MATKDGFQPDRSPIFLSEHAEETGQPDIGTADIGKAWQRAAISSRNPQGEYLGNCGDSDRHRDPVGGRSSRAA